MVHRCFSAAPLLLMAAAVRAATYNVPPLSISFPDQTAPAAASAPAAEPAADAADDSGYGITGNWFGARDSLHKNHVDVAGSIQFDASKVLRAGLDTRAWPTSYLLDVHATFDMEGALGLKGGTLFICFQSHDQSENGDAAVGDIQVFDNISAPRYVEVAQFWYRQTAGDFRFKVGKIDGNADACRPSEDANDCFSLMEHGLDFLQSAAAFTPTIFAMPTFPNPAPGAEIFWGKDFYLGAGTFYSNQHATFLNISGHIEKGAPTAGNMFTIAEAGARWNWDPGNSWGGPGHAGAGGWYHCGNFPRADGTGTNRGAAGAYAFIDQSLFHEEKENNPVRDLGMFFEAGYADPTTAPMDENLVLGICAGGFVPGRPDDALGVMVSWVHLPGRGLAHRFELATEAYYKIQVTKWASIKPSFAYIVSPSGIQPDAAVASVRVEVDF